MTDIGTLTQRHTTNATATLTQAIALHVPGKLEWDSKTQRFTNSPEANKFVKPVFKKGWELKI